MTKPISEHTDLEDERPKRCWCEMWEEIENDQLAFSVFTIQLFWESLMEKAQFCLFCGSKLAETRNYWYEANNQF